MLSSVLMEMERIGLKALIKKTGITTISVSGTLFLEDILNSFGATYSGSGY